MEHINSSPLLIREFLMYMQTIKGKSQRTVSEYFFDLRLFFRFIKLHRGLVKSDAEFDDIIIDNIDLNLIKGITLLDLYEFLNFLSTKRGLSARSRARKVACLRSYFKYLSTKAKLIDDDPAKNLESPRQKKELPKHLSLDESIGLLRSVDGNNKERDYAILVLFLNCGMRLSELVSINITDVRDDTITVLGKGNKERTIYLNEACIEAIGAYLAVRSNITGADRNAMFLSRNSRRISVKTVQWLVKKHLKMSGLDETKYSTHKLRHTAATLMYQYGNVDIRSLQEILGHEQLSTTQIYTHIDNQKLRDAANLNPLANIKKQK